MLGLSTWFNAVIYLPISLATVLAQTMTIFITILAPLMLAETVGPRRAVGRPSLLASKGPES